MNLPQDFIERTCQMLGREGQQLIHSLDDIPPTSIRYSSKYNGEVEGERVPWCSQGVYLQERPSFTFDPLFHAGVYYVQEASSMFLEHVVRQLVTSPVMALDLCAAPGGKATLLAQTLPAGSVVVANEIVRQRAFILSENIQKCGVPSCVVTNNAPQAFTPFRGLFNFILVDAPCSGEGMFRKDPSSIAEWSIDNVKRCATRQREILSDIYPTLAERGLLVYSTCTYNQEENEDQVRWLCDVYGMERVSICVNSEWRITTNEWGCHFYPHKTKGEGLFVSVLRKSEPTPTIKIKGKIINSGGAMKGVSVSDDLTPITIGKVVHGIPNYMQSYVSFLLSKLQVLHAGVPLYEPKGRDYILQTGLALSLVFDRSQWPMVELERSEAIRYLQKDSITLGEAPMGFVAVSYGGYPLGWVKNLGNRCNNLYPSEWRVRSKWIPFVS